MRIKNYRRIMNPYKDSKGEIIKVVDKEKIKILTEYIRNLAKEYPVSLYHFTNKGALILLPSVKVATTTARKIRLQETTKDIIEVKDIPNSAFLLVRLKKEKKEEL